MLECTCAYYDPHREEAKKWLNVVTECYNKNKIGGNEVPLEQLTFDVPSE